MLEQIKATMDEEMTKAIKSLQHQFTRVRTGRANANILDGVSVDYYGSPTPIKQVDAQYHQLPYPEFTSLN